MNQSKPDPAEQLTAMKRMIGKKGIYIEGGTFCIATIRSVDGDANQFSALLAAGPETLICHYRENPIRFEESSSPFGEEWSIGKDWNWFYLSDDYWDGSLYMGFRFLFNEAYVAAFLNRDLSWTDEIF